MNPKCPDEMRCQPWIWVLGFGCRQKTKPGDYQGKAIGRARVNMTTYKSNWKIPAVQSSIHGLEKPHTLYPSELT